MYFYSENTLNVYKMRLELTNDCLTFRALFENMKFDHKRMTIRFRDGFEHFKLQKSVDKRTAVRPNVPAHCPSTELCYN